jgi:hypothetical protein|tara:strand:+ start:252 stop:1097 length:846 start_codon:yes stop_codon:yes gene_type:complete
MSNEQMNTTEAVETPIETTSTPVPSESTVLGSTNDDGDWKSSLPDELKNDATLQNFKDIESLAKTVVHQQKVLGSRIPIPKTDEEKSELYGKLGRPETPEKYEINIPETHKEYFQDENVKQFKNVAHKIGLNSEQVNAIMDYQMKAIDNQVSTEPSKVAVQREETENNLKKEWGFEYDKNVRAAQRALDVYGDDDIKKLMNTEAGNNPAVIKMFARLGAEVTEDMAKNTQHNTLATSPLDAQTEIDNIFSNAKDPYHDNMHKDHMQRVEHMRQLHEKRFGK